MRYTTVIAIGLALVFAVVSIATILQKSPTVDEPAHLFAGYSHLKWADFRTNTEHPPLVKILAALPLLFMDIPDPRPAPPHWSTIKSADEKSLSIIDSVITRFYDNADPEKLFFYPKILMVCVALLLGASIYLVGKRCFGVDAALAAVFIYTFDPNILAHGSIIHTDIPFAAIFFIGTYFFCSFLERATWQNLVSAAFFAGLAAVTKYSYTILIPVWGILAAVKIISSESHWTDIRGFRNFTKRSRKLSLLCLAAVVVIAVSYFVVWTVYDLRYDAIPGGLHHFRFGRPENPIYPTFEVIDFLQRHRVFPEAWLFGQLVVIYLGPRPAYLLGHYSMNGFWSYFPIVFLVKTPLPTLALLTAGAWMIVKNRLDRRRMVYLLTPAIMYFAFAVLSRVNIGLRHVLPIYPFLFVFAGATATTLWKSGNRATRGVLMILTIWYLAICVLTYPNYLSYFNELVGGAKNGHKVLIDSNLDWGQDLKGLKRWLDDNGVKKVRMLYFGHIFPEAYGIDASYEPGKWFTFEPPEAGGPQYLVISATLLYGAEVLLEGQEREIAIAYRNKTPAAVINNTLYVYKLGMSRQR
jgi:4-amino-4-deoxy-L-arabinose transferase-like glycosyltransferase